MSRRHALHVSGENLLPFVELDRLFNIRTGTPERGSFLFPLELALAPSRN